MHTTKGPVATANLFRESDKKLGCQIEKNHVFAAFFDAELTGNPMCKPLLQSQSDCNRRS